MTTVSKPIIYNQAAIDGSIIDAADTNVDGDVWAQLNYRDLGLESSPPVTFPSADVVRIPTGTWGMWRGFRLTVTANEDITVPAVVTPTTYVVGVLFDATKYSTKAGPLRFAAFKLVDKPANFWTLYEFDRTQNVTLAVSPMRSMRAWRSGVSSVAAGVAVLPPPAEYPHRHLLVADNGIYRRADDGASWVLLTADTGERTDGFSVPNGWVNQGSTWSVLNGVKYLDLCLKRTGVSFTANATTGALGDVFMIKAPEAARSRHYLWAGTGSVNIGGSPSVTFGFDCRIYNDGRALMTAAAPGLTITTGSIVYVSAVYR